MSALDAKVAEKVLGTHWVYPYTTDAGCDYEVLKHVREHWSENKHDEFTAALGAIWVERRKAVRTNFAMCYEPGDYSKAALKALGEEIG
jgi:hypothetical protein